MVAALERLGVDELLDELGRARPDDVAADQLAVLRVADDLDHPVAVTVDRARADRAVLELADDDVVARLLRLLLGQAERADVRRAERRARDVDVLDRVRLLARGVLDGDDALVGGLVRERRAGDEIADRIDAVAARLQRAVDLDEAVVLALDAGVVQPEALDVGAAPGRDDEPVDLGALATVGELHARVARLDVLDRGAGDDLDALLLEAALGDLGDLGVLARQHAVDHLQEVDLGAEAHVGRGDLGPGRAGADDRQRARHLLERPRLLGADDAPAEVRAGDALRHRPGREDHALRRLVLVVADADVAVAGESAGALEHLDLVLLEQPCHAARQGLDDLRAALHDGGVVDLRVAHLQAEVAGVADLLQHVGGAQDRLGRDARVVEAAAADPVLLHDRDLHPELGGADGGNVAAPARADDDAVEGSHGGGGRYLTRCGAWSLAMTRLSFQNSQPPEPTAPRHTNNPTTFDAPSSI